MLRVFKTVVTETVMNVSTATETVYEICEDTTPEFSFPRIPKEELAALLVDLMQFCSDSQKKYFTRLEVIGGKPIKITLREVIRSKNFDVTDISPDDPVQCIVDRYRTIQPHQQSQ